MINGLYVATFSSSLGGGAGVIFLEDAHLRGGDSSMFFLGMYHSDGDVVRMSITADTHTRQPGAVLLFGQERATLQLTGRFAGTEATLQGTSAAAPRVTFTATLRRVAR